MLNADDTVNVVITNTFFSDNTGFAEGAGGVYLSSIGTATVNAELTRVQFLSNEGVTWAGALALENYANSNPLHFSIDSCLFDHNNSNGQGGAINSYIYPGTTGTGSVGTTKFIRLIHQ